MWKFLVVPVILSSQSSFFSNIQRRRSKLRLPLLLLQRRKLKTTHTKALSCCWTWKVCVWENSQSVRKWALINQPWQSQPPGNGCSSINSNSGLLAPQWVGGGQSLLSKLWRPAMTCCGLWPLLDGKILCWWPSTLNWLMLTRAVCLIGSYWTIKRTAVYRVTTWF